MPKTTQAHMLSLQDRINHYRVRGHWHLMAIAMAQTEIGHRERATQATKGRRFNWLLIAVNF